MTGVVYRIQVLFWLAFPPCTAAVGGTKLPLLSPPLAPPSKRTHPCVSGSLSEKCCDGRLQWQPVLASGLPSTLLLGSHSRWLSEKSECHAFSAREPRVAHDLHGMLTPGTYGLCSSVSLRFVRCTADRPLAFQYHHLLGIRVQPLSQIKSAAGWQGIFGKLNSRVEVRTGPWYPRPVNSDSQTLGCEEMDGGAPDSLPSENGWMLS